LVALLALAPCLSPAARATPEQDYANGEFAAAESGWRAAVELAPTDPAAHHNLSLALAQQGRWAEAAAHATVAFVQNPRDPALQWNLEYTLGRGGYTP